MPAQLIEEFDTWQPGYGGATVRVYIAGTTNDASLFTDEALTVAASNPQTLDSNSDGAGKFVASLYTSSAYTLDIDSTDQTGIQRPPLTDLDGEDASDAVVTTTDGSRARALDDRFDDWIHALDYGALGAVAATNDTTLTAAIGVAAANSGGRVLVPDGTYPFVDLTLPAGVVLEGEGRGVTTLQCQTADKCITLSGDKAGLARLTLDGVDNTAGGIGVYSKANDETVFDDVEVKRFETGTQFKGGRRAAWRDFTIDTCGTGAKLHGDNDAGGGADGDEYRNNLWIGGRVRQCTTIGVDLSFEDKKAYHNTFQEVGFEDNTGTAINFNGCRWTRNVDCWWSGNTTDFAVGDDGDTDNALINTVIGLTFRGGSISGGAVTFTGTCQDVLFDRLEIADVDFTFTQPLNNILARDCVEDSSVTLSGNSTKWTRQNTALAGDPYSAGTTNDAVATKAWSITLEPGQRGYIEAVIVGNQSNAENHAQYHISREVHRPGSTLAYDAQTANFTLGETVTGGTSGATGLIIADADGGATGTLTLRNIIGVFENDEALTDSATGAAVVNGTLTAVNAALLGGATNAIAAAVETDANWAADFNASAGDIEIKVTGVAAQNIDWVVAVKCTLS